jgi:hypothetical protein
MGRWLPAIAASAVLVVVLVAGVSGRSKGSDASTTSDSLTPSAGAIAGLTVPSTTAPEVVVQTDPAVPKSQLTSTLRKGSAGSEVKFVQQRLTDLGFAPGPIDGQFGSGTEQAVWAFEKLILKTPRAQATGKVTNEMWQSMQDNLVVSPERPSGLGTTHVEIFLPQQVLIVFTDDKPKLIAHIATGVENADGSPMQWCATVTYDTGYNGEPLDTPVTKAVCALAKTPGGVFKFNRRYSGNRIGPLGGMFNPVYFNYGIAVHGARNVPLEPASHGCVRLNEAIAQYFPSLVSNGDSVYVWGEDGKQPEQYTKNESLPSFNAPDPNATTTTSSTTSTTSTTSPTSTTEKPATTTSVKPSTTTTAKPAATTTSKPVPATTVAPAPTTVDPPPTSAP